MTPSPEETIRIAEEAGYSDVRLHGYAPLACSEDDLFRQRFTAVGPTGKTVSGVICSAPLKGSTIRLTPTSVFSGG